MSTPGSDPLDLDEHLGAIVAGDADAFARWVARAEPSLRLSLRSLAAHVDVEAIVQEALLRVWQAAPRFVSDGRPNGLLRLGVRIAHNLAVSERRRLRASAVPEDMIERLLEEAGEVAVEPAPDPILRRRIEECRDKLPERPSQALGGRLACVGGEPDESIAARLGMRLNTFLQNFTRARRLLAECLEAHGLRLKDLVR